jgi:hypothetical protein
MSHDQAHAGDRTIELRPELCVGIKSWPTTIVFGESDV